MIFLYVVLQYQHYPVVIIPALYKRENKANHLLTYNITKSLFVCFSSVFIRDSSGKTTYSCSKFFFDMLKRDLKIILNCSVKRL